MDTSETYIKMCQMAEVIQKLFNTSLPAGTFWARQSEGYYSEGVTGYNFKRLEEWIILPRQDQLQEMVDGSSWGKAARFAQFVWGDRTGEITEYAEMLLSMEQLWLAFVMQEKFGRVWTGKDWVEIDGSANPG